MRQMLAVVCAVGGILLCSTLADAQTFTYQGMLKQAGVPASGNYDFQFSLWTAASGGSQVGSTLTRSGVNVAWGVFSVELDFGSVWDGSDRYLQIAVRPAGSGSYTTLSPRVKVNAVPYAVRAGVASPAGAAGGDLSGSYPNPTVAGLQGRAVASIAPSAGQVLKWDGNAWSPGVDLRDAFWQASGSSIFYNGGHVGIGTSAPSVRLSLGDGNANTKLALWQGSAAADVMGFGVGPSQFRLHLHNSTNRFSFLDAPNGNEIVTILGSGNVGIGTTSPQARLHVNGDIRLANDRSIFGLGQLVGYNDLRLYGDATGGPDVYISASGNVGISTLNPQAQLHVAGNAFFTNNSATLQVLPGNLFGQNQTNAATLEIPGNGTIGVWDDLTITGTLRAYGNLHVGGNTFTLGGATDPTWRRVELGASKFPNTELFTGYLLLYGAQGRIKTFLTWLGNNPDHGYIAVSDASESTRAGLYVNSDGRGVLFADVKSFREPDPEDPTRDIWYGCIEGPEIAMYVRGTARLVNGRARIGLPDHFRKLADEQGMTVQLTPRSAESRGLAAVRVSLDGIEVVELLNGRGNYEFDWRVEAVRKDHRDFRVYRPWDEALPGATDPAQAWDARLRSIQARQARQREVRR